MERIFGYDLQEKTQAEQDRLDAQRYRKFRKAYLDGTYPDKFTWLETPEEFDAAVDVLPDVKP